jgi:hypothetical protein
MATGHRNRGALAPIQVPATPVGGWSKGPHMREEVRKFKTGLTLTERRLKVQRLHRLGVDVHAIAERLGMSIPTIRGDLKAAEKWVELGD